jgi:hypothetical protein
MKLSGIASPDAWIGLRNGVLLGSALAVLMWRPAVPAHAAWSTPLATQSVSTTPLQRPNLSADVASADARIVADWVADSRDNGGRPFVILDKRDARVLVFDAQARLIDSSPVLLGAAAGDDSVVGIGQRPIAQVRPEERTTPAGRFVSRPGRNASGEDVVWVDYDAAVSMHRVRPVDPKERRLERLASNDPSQRRISYGCINVPVAFFDRVVQPVLGTQAAVVYVLPEVKAARAVFAAAYAGDPSDHGL